jgi:catechol 2,3-dioxygenase-like lactoylglutathione lyase family enzyme
MIDHLALQVRDVRVSAAFYDVVLAPLGGRRQMERGDLVAFGVDRPTFWLGPLAEEDTGKAREIHLAFVAPDRATVRAFHEAAVGTGAEVLHPPRVRPEYHHHYYGAFVRDPDGNNVEAVCHTPG